MKKEEHLSPSVGWAKHSRNSDVGSKQKVNKMRRRKMKKAIKDLVIARLRSEDWDGKKISIG